MAYFAPGDTDPSTGPVQRVVASIFKPAMNIELLASTALGSQPLGVTLLTQRVLYIL
jgi:hypothetical protein